MKHQKGSGHVGILVAVAVLAVVGLAGWFVVRSNDKPKANVAATDRKEQVDETKKTRTVTEPGLSFTESTTDENSEAALAQRPPETPDAFAGWKAYTFDDQNFSFKIPGDDGWYYHNMPGDYPGETQGTVVGSAGVNYGKSCRECGSAFSVRVVKKGSAADPGEGYGKERAGSNPGYTLVSETSVTKQDVSGTRREYNPNDPAFEKIVYYYFNKDDLSYLIRLNYLETEGRHSDQFDTITWGEKIFSTFAFL